MRRSTFLRASAFVAGTIAVLPGAAQIGSFVLADRVGDDASTFEHRELIGHREFPYAGQGATYSLRQRNELQTWFWYRTEYDPREYAFSAQTAGWVGDTTASLTHDELVTGQGGRPLRFTVDYSLTHISPGRSLVETAFTLTHRGQGSLTIDLFNFNDIDMLDTQFDDSARYVGANAQTHMVTDPEGAVWSATASTAGLTGSVIDSAGILKMDMSDAFTNDYALGGDPFLDGDVAGVFQWTVTLQPGESFRGSVVQRLDVVPEPATLTALGLGLLAAFRRRRHR